MGMGSRFPGNGSELRARFEKTLNDIEMVLNHSADTEAQWWPFGFMRPRPEQRFTSARAAALAVLQGLPVGMFLILLDRAARHAPPERSLLGFLFAICVGVFVANRCTVAYFWNRRAGRLARGRDRRELRPADG
jgi:hypothetical protein